MTRDYELWACALRIERDHGEGAWLHAAMKVDRFNTRGMKEAAGVWREVLKRLEALDGHQGSAPKGASI